MVSAERYSHSQPRHGVARQRGASSSMPVRHSPEHQVHREVPQHSPRCDAGSEVLPDTPSAGRCRPCLWLPVFAQRANRAPDARPRRDNPLRSIAQGSNRPATRACQPDQTEHHTPCTEAESAARRLGHTWAIGRDRLGAKRGHPRLMFKAHPFEGQCHAVSRYSSAWRLTSTATLSCTTDKVGRSLSRSTPAPRC